MGAPLGSLMIAFRQVHPPHGEQAPNTHSTENMVHRESQYPQHGEHGAHITQRANTHSTVHPQLGATEGKQCAPTARKAPTVGSQIVKVHTQHHSQTDIQPWCSESLGSTKAHCSQTRQSCQESQKSNQPTATNCLCGRLVAFSAKLEFSFRLKT